MWLKWLSEQPSVMELTYRPPADEATLVAVERDLGAPLHVDLRALLSESNGLRGAYGLGVIWSCARIAEENHKLRTLPVYAENHMPFGGIVFFADAGNGDLFGFPALAGGPGRRIYAWDHEDDSRRRVARDLRDYLARRLGGQLLV